MRLATSPFKKIASGEKTIEARLYDEKRQKLSVGDQIEFTCIEDSSKKTTTRIRALYRYSSFKDLFSDFSPDLFGAKSKKELIEEIETFYSKDAQKNYGVIGIKLDLIK